MSLAALRSSSKNMLDKMKTSEKHDQNQSGTRAVDERIWKPTFDKEKGSGTAIIRFLPAAPAEVEELPYVKIYSHAFQGPTGKWYIEKSLSSIGKPDPCGELNKRCWNSGVESDKDNARSRKRKTTYFANILVIKDPAHPELEGKVMIYEYGPQIHKMIEDAAYPPAPEFEGDEAVEALNAFDIDNGADFVIRITGRTLKNSKGQNITVPNYEKSSFKAKAPLANGKEKEMERIWNECHLLQPFYDQSEFKTYEALQKRLVEVLGPQVGSGIPTAGGTTISQNTANDDDDDDSQPVRQPARPAPASSSSEPDDEDLAFLRDLD